MSVQPVQSHGAEQVVAQSRHVPSQAEAADSRASSTAFAPKDAVVVSDQARQLAAKSQQQGENLQLDFRQLREMAFREQAAKSESE
ncbi:MAG: hypothetical protein U0133_21560 [Gemmatimonadales bacterium]